MSDKFCVSITNSKLDTDKCTVGFVVATAALGSDRDTLVFLSADGVYAAQRGYAETVDEGAPFAPLKDLIDKFLAAGGKLWVCTPCMKKRNLEVGDLMEGAQPAGGAALVEWLSDGSPSIVY